MDDNRLTIQRRSSQSAVLLFSYYEDHPRERLTCLSFSFSIPLCLIPCLPYSFPLCTFNATSLWQSFVGIRKEGDGSFPFLILASLFTDLVGPILANAIDRRTAKIKQHVQREGTVHWWKEVSRLWLVNSKRNAYLHTYFCFYRSICHIYRPKRCISTSMRKIQKNLTYRYII